MNESSQEAKQAAEEIYHPDAKHLVHAFSLGYDTATTKAREELEATRRERDAANEDYHKLQIDHAKLRKELEYWKEQVPMPTKTTDDYLANAHQQPSATCSCNTDLICPVHGWATRRMTEWESKVAAQALAADFEQPSAITTNEQAYRDGTLSQPNAPTADVEKIAREAAHELHLQAYILEPSDNGLVNILSKYFTQACVPLVEALERIARQLPSEAALIAHAALTGTGEKWQQALDQQQQTNAEIVENVRSEQAKAGNHECEYPAGK
jgi:hypothetical protein